MSAAKILVVDDEVDVERLVKRRFRREIRDGRYQFEFARDGEEALARVLGSDDIAIVLCDINMPKMDGLALLARLRELERDLATVMVSAYGDLKNIRLAMNRGAFDFVTKPIDFEDLASTIDKTERYIAALRETKVARARLAVLDKELEVAGRIQGSILPGALPATAEFEVFAQMLPVRTVGGDFYGVFELEEGLWGLLIADVSGKGIPAAIFMGVVHTMVRTVAAREPDPGRCLRQVNDLLCRNVESGTLASMFLAQYRPGTGELRHASAGHNAPYLLKPGAVPRALEGERGVVLGVEPGLAYAVSTERLSPGDSVVLYTDGITEAMGARREQFGEERLAALLAEGAGLRPKALTRKIIAAIKRHSSKATQSDDITCLVLRRDA